ncbi:MAG: hypothetical protein JNM07_02455 [Phycisphaerae bacterium]|nr:hypothetical protein [Phycisphaerae bacterium]
MSQAVASNRYDPFAPNPAWTKIKPADASFPGAAGLSTGLIGLGVACIAVVAAVALGMVKLSGSESGLKYALFSYHVGFAVALGMSLGSLGVVMILNAFAAGWSTTLRRQFENAAAMLPVVLALFLPVLAAALLAPGKMFKWMDAAAVAGEPLAEHKAPYLNINFWILRAAIFFAIWLFLSWRMVGLSRAQDESGDRRITSRLRAMSCWGLPLFALSLTFAGFDWFKGLDYKWFSTMFGVYYFAGNTLLALALIIVTLALLRRAGRLQGLVTEDHFHDLGKLLFSFTVFWAYVAFSQYFLIWYANIPEETAWYQHRMQGGWQVLGALMIVGHFIGPFLILLFRAVKRSPTLLALVAVWQFLMCSADLFYVIRPMAYPDSSGLEHVWLDVLGWLGPVLVLLGFFARRVASNPLVPLKDPRLHEAMAHKNYV